MTAPNPASSCNRLHGAGMVAGLVLVGVRRAWKARRSER
jgi:hypothetical protein